MKRYFNTEGACRPDAHYMVGLEGRLDEIKRRFVDRGKYFVINRGRQYGKTTTLRLLADYLKNDYLVISLDFQLMSSSNFRDENAFVISFAEYLENYFRTQSDFVKVIGKDAFQSLLLIKDERNASMDKLFRVLSRMCEAALKPVIVIIDEVDSASNHQVFLDFLAMLRGYYLNRENTAFFQSVILAGVYDIKNLRLKLRPEEEHQYNSPWNIAAEFNIEMDFSEDQIKRMLSEYEADHRTGMDVAAVAEEIYGYTSGYPYLVSAVCKIMDEILPENRMFSDSQNVWKREGVAGAVKIILKSRIPLFDSMVKQLDTFKDLRDMVEEVLYQGKQIPFSPDIRSVNMGIMFGFLKEKDDQVVVANRIFEMRMMNLFIVGESVKSDAFKHGQCVKNQFIVHGKLDMKLVLEKFVEYFTDIYGGRDEKFVEEHGRKIFLLYLKPIINGTGNYYMEAQTRDSRRTDVIVDYLGEQFIVELKIWRGNEYHERGEKQLTEYLDYYHKQMGYLISFNFNKKKECGVKELQIGDKTIIEAMV